VKDRENKDAVVICVEEEGMYRWKTTEGIDCHDDLMSLLN
jgi:hypothetical protein